MPNDSYCLFAAGMVILLGAFGPWPDPTSRPTTTSGPATSEPAVEQVTSLVNGLRSPSFKVREQSQAGLRALGPAALGQLIPFLSDKDAEVARRVAEIVDRPRDPVLRVEAAVRLLATTDPDWMERAVYMLFEDPPSVCDGFFQRTKGAAGAEAVIYAPIAEKLRDAVRRHRMMQSRHERMKDKPEIVARERKMNSESDQYDAEAAYWTAYEGLVDFEEQQNAAGSANDRVTSRPARQKRG